MVRTSRKKLTLWIIVGIVVFVAAATAVFFLMQKANSPTAQSDEALSGVPDYGACELITTDVIKAARGGNSIATISEGSREGVDGLNGEEADSCKFTFTTASTSNNTLTVSVYPYSPNEEAYKKETEVTQWYEVSGPKPTPYFGKTTLDNNKTSLYMLRVIPGAKTILISLRQPEDAKTFKEPDAINFLVDISTKVNFGELERSAAQEAEDTTEGDGPGAPPTDVQNDVLTADDTEPN